MATVEERRICSICERPMEARKVKATLALLPVVYHCTVCDVAPPKTTRRRAVG